MFLNRSVTTRLTLGSFISILALYRLPNCVLFCLVCRQIRNVESHCFKLIQFFVVIVMVKYKYSQTWANDHLRITTTCLQRPPFLGPIFNFHNIKLPLNSDHLSTTVSNLGSQGWSLYTGLTVQIWVKLKGGFFCPGW